MTDRALSIVSRQESLPPESPIVVRLRRISDRHKEQHVKRLNGTEEERQGGIRTRGTKGAAEDNQELWQAKGPPGIRKKYSWDLRSQEASNLKSWQLCMR